MSGVTLDVHKGMHVVYNPKRGKNPVKGDSCGLLPPIFSNLWHFNSMCFKWPFLNDLKANFVLWGIIKGHTPVLFRVYY